MKKIVFSIITILCHIMMFGQPVPGGSGGDPGEPGNYVGGENTVVPLNRNVFPGSGQVTFTVITNEFWQIEESETWLDVYPDLGTGSSVITVTFDTNASKIQRIGTLTFKDPLPPFFPDVQFTVTQSGLYYDRVWDGNPQNSMNIFIDSATYKGEPIYTGYEIGIFDVDNSRSEICVGVGTVDTVITSASVLEIIVAADEISSPEKDGYSEGNEIIYKFYNHYAMQEITNIHADYNPAYDEVFTSTGTALVGLYGSDKVFQTVSMISGWNIISFHVTPDDLDMLNIMDPLITSGELVKVLDEAGGFIQNIPGYGWINTIGDMANTEGYYVNVSANTLHTTEGLPVLLPYSIPLLSGWNIIGYPVTESQDALGAVQSLIDADHLDKVIDETGHTIVELPPPIGWYNSIGSFLPGKGYYTRVNANTSLLFNEPARSLVPYAPEQEGDGQYPDMTDSGERNPYLPMNIFVSDIQIEGLDVSDGDVVAVFDGNVSVGTGTVDKDLQFIDIITSMDDPLTSWIDGFGEGNDISFKFFREGFSEPVSMNATGIFGKKVFEPLETYVCELKGSALGLNEIQVAGFDVECYPNPIKQDASIVLHVEQDGRISMGIYDLTGRKLKDVLTGEISAGDHRLSIDQNNLTNGVFILKATWYSGDTSEIRMLKLVKN